jgi:hypothetical protein
MTTQASRVLAGIPASLRDELIEAFRKIERNFREGRWEPSELNGGKLCEVAYCILKGHVDGAFPAAASKPKNMVDACKALESSGTQFPRSVRIQIPRMLIALYEIRNNRGVGHVGGDVDPNHMDATCVLYIAKWVLSELIRVFHGVSTDQATEIVDALSDRELTLLWKINGMTRVLDTSLSMTEQTLLLLYGSQAGMSEIELLSSIEHSNPSVFRRDILRRAHKKRWIDYDETARQAAISPLGSKHVERTILSRGFAV